MKAPAKKTKRRSRFEVWLLAQDPTADLTYLVKKKRYEQKTVQASWKAYFAGESCKSEQVKDLGENLRKMLEAFYATVLQLPEGHVRTIFVKNFMDTPSSASTALQRLVSKG